MVFLDGKLLFSHVDDIDSWNHGEKISLARKPPIHVDVGDYPPGPQPSPKTVESKIVARVEMKNKQDENILCILCYELVEYTRTQTVKDIVKIKQELLR